MLNIITKEGRLMDAFNLTIASAAISSPLWLSNIGGLASLFLPIFGIIWLAIQIVHRLNNWNKPK